MYEYRKMLCFLHRYETPIVIKRKIRIPFRAPCLLIIIVPMLIMHPILRISTDIGFIKRFGRNCRIEHEILSYCVMADDDGHGSGTPSEAGGDAASFPRLFSCEMNQALS